MTQLLQQQQMMMRQPFLLVLQERLLVPLTVSAVMAQVQLSGVQLVVRVA
jgi:hypothetical protein